MKRAALLLLLPCASLAHAARAEPTQAVVSLEYSASAGCPDAAGFRSQVLGRTQRVSFASEATAAELIWSVTTAETSGGSRGTLRVSGSRPGQLERSVTAATCEQVVSALALVAALSVDPDASLTAREEAPPPPAPPPPAPRVERAPEPQPKPASTNAKSGTRLAIGITLTGRSGLEPKVSWAPRPFIGLSFRSRGGYTWGVALSAAQTHAHATGDVGQADFTWSLARLEAFPVRASFGPLRLEPAVFLEAGQLRARGAAVTPVAEVRRPALLAGALARLSFLAFDVLTLQVEGGPILPVTRDRFYLFENATVFRISPLTGFVAAGVGLEFL